MKKVLFAATAAASLLGLACSAQAGDLGLTPPTYDWSGGYFGVNAGVGFDATKMKSDYVYTGAPDDLDEDTGSSINGLNMNDTADDTRFIGGLSTGYNWQMSNFVFGVEADINYVGFDASQSQNVAETFSNVFSDTDVRGSNEVRFENGWLGTIRGGLGYAMDNILVYGTGGLAFGDSDITSKLSASAGDESVSWDSKVNDNKVGWTAGAGVEYGIDRWTMGLEYLYVDLGSRDWSTKGNIALEDDQSVWQDVQNKGEVDIRFNLARATLKYRF